MSSAFTPFVDSSTSSSFGQTNNSNRPLVIFGAQIVPRTSGGTGTTVQGIPSPPIMGGGSSSGSMSSTTIASGQSTKPNGSALTNGVTPMGANSSSTNILGSSTVETDKSRTDVSAGKESKHQEKLQSDEMEKSVELICKDVISHQEDMKSWIGRYRSLELEKIEDTQTIKQLREELAQASRSKDAIIAEYLESPAFTERLDEEHQKRLSEIFHPCYVKALGTVQTKSSPGTVQTKLPEIDTWEMVSPLHKSRYDQVLYGMDWQSLSR